MSIVLSVKAIVTIAGALTYGLTNGKLSTLGLVAYGAGLLTLLMAMR